ncbi:hypothetical protein BJ508DRAFT_324042 [Ascobolus immersus RN42]|uniref:Uncharacterized protein n=1 Tax=Ascobolus immersus RN42 TaxID=1160509 RepID=A0A3N4ID52_ASCIM|nr:hypothetical protein BJ508DRAFT_324042 [Ascobolus immersus RN42]
MVPIALDPDFESLAESLTSLSLDLEESDPLNALLREAAQAASLAKEQSLAARRQSFSQPEHRSLQEILTTASLSAPSDASASSMDISPISPQLDRPQLSYSQSARKRIHTLACSPQKRQKLETLPTTLHKRPREVDYTSTFRFVKLWFRDGHWSDNLEPTFRKDAPAMPNIPALIASLRRRKSDATMASSVSRSSSRLSNLSTISGEETETESTPRRRNRSPQREDTRPQYLTPQKGKQPKSYRSSTNLYELPQGVKAEKAAVSYTPSCLSSSRFRDLESEMDEGQIEPLNRAVGAEGKDGVDITDDVFIVPKLRKRPGMGRRGSPGVGGSPSGSQGGGVQRSGGTSGSSESGGMPFWMPMGHTNGGNNGSSGAMEGVHIGR